MFVLAPLCWARCAPCMSKRDSCFARWRWHKYLCVWVCVNEVDKEEAQDKWQTKTALMRRWVKKQRKWILNIFVLIIIVLVAQQRGGETLEVRLERERERERVPRELDCVYVCVRVWEWEAEVQVAWKFAPHFGLLPLPHVNKCKMLQHCGNWSQLKFLHFSHSLLLLFLFLVLFVGLPFLFVYLYILI